MRVLKLIAASIVLVQCGIARAQVLTSVPCFSGSSQLVGVATAQCTGNIGFGNTTDAIGLSFTTNVCSTINTPPSWTKLACLAFSTSSAAIYFQTNGAGNNTCTALNTPFSCCTGLHTGTCDTPTFTWTGNSNVTANEINEEGVLAASQLDTSTTNSGTSTTSMTASALTTATPLEHILAWYFTDNASSGVTFTAAADMGLMQTFNGTSYDSFVTEKRQKIPASTGAETGTASASSNYAAFLMAFKPLNPPVGRSFGDALPLFSLTLGNGSIPAPNNSGNIRFTGTNSFDAQCGAAGIACVNGSNGVVNFAPGSGQVSNFWAGGLSNIVMSASALGLQVLNGFVISSAGGTAPTATCSGGSTGVVVEAGNASCTGNLTPFQCCTGASAGTCPGSTNNAGEMITSSVASTNCTVTWSASGFENQSPRCGFFDVSGSTTPTSFARGVCGTSTCVYDFTSATSKVVGWLCL